MNGQIIRIPSDYGCNFPAPYASIPSGYFHPLRVAGTMSRFFRRLELTDAVRWRVAHHSGGVSPATCPARRFTSIAGIPLGARASTPALIPPQPPETRSSSPAPSAHVRLKAKPPSRPPSGATTYTPPTTQASPTHPRGPNVVDASSRQIARSRRLGKTSPRFLAFR